MKYIQRKCGADFRLSVRRLWKDPAIDKRHNTPHSDRYGVRVRRTRPATGIYTKVSVVRLVLIAKKTSTFSNKDLRKTLSQYVMPSGQNRMTLQMYEKVFINGQHSLGYCNGQMKYIEVYLIYAR